MSGWIYSLVQVLVILSAFVEALQCSYQKSGWISDRILSHPDMQKGENTICRSAYKETSDLDFLDSIFSLIIFMQK